MRLVGVVTLVLALCITMAGCGFVRVDIDGVVRYTPPGPSKMTYYREYIDSDGKFRSEYRKSSQRSRR